jgi:hypothetical protein
MEGRDPRSTCENRAFSAQLFAAAVQTSTCYTVHLKATAVHHKFDFPVESPEEFERRA